ncbi:MFS transporter [Paractinoplanes lichenicola]|uniref:MFS transporter n=1 Tax=Paractinoplanes lichenicola TaxID=2802976 RepID=A0ABS1VVT0_9ACTN|nr:MFS transporter [Actinoplanes lichenicola]MBL7258538.1 MFS transporter [Actinoplanes lichenicola]
MKLVLACLLGGSAGWAADRRVKLALACLLGGSAGWAMTAPGAGAPVLASGYGAGLLWVGLLTSALAFPYAALQFPSGVLVDRFGVRATAVTGLSLVVVAHVAALVAPLPWLAVGARFASGAGFAVCFVCGTSLARDSGTGPRGMGIFGGVALAASGFAVLVVPFASLVLGWRAAWATTLAVVLPALVLSALSPGGSARRVSPRGAGSVRDGQLFRLAAVHAATLGLGVVLSSWATTLLTDIWNFSSAVAAVVGSAVLGLSVLSRPLGGHIAALWPGLSRTVWVVALVACAAATIALSWRSTPVVAVLAVITLGMFSGLPFASVVSAGQARLPERPAAAVGLTNTAAFGLVVAATPIVGWAADHGYASWTLVAVAALWLLPLTALPRIAAPTPQPLPDARTPSTF